MQQLVQFLVDCWRIRWGISEFRPGNGDWRHAHQLLEVIEQLFRWRSFHEHTRQVPSLHLLEFGRPETDKNVHLPSHLDSCSLIEEDSESCVLACNFLAETFQYKWTKTFSYAVRCFPAAHYEILGNFTVWKHLWEQFGSVRTRTKRPVARRNFRQLHGLSIFDVYIMATWLKKDHRWWR